MRRSYRQFCGVARALDVIGDRWTLLIVRNLLLGPRRYSDLLAELPGLTTNLLAARLAQMEAAELIERKQHPGVSRWALTSAGAALEPVVMELGRFGYRYMDAPRKTDTVNIGWGLLSLKRRYTGKVRGVLGLKVGSIDFELAFSPTRLDVQQRAAVRPDATITGALVGFQRLLFRGEPLQSLREANALSVEGDARRMLGSMGVVLDERKGGNATAARVMG